ncbi:hypothetical protein Taro_052329 [Colocasia esculenta]|uniref:Uncharacterized protein n=1 Tax=Colocasia esculenta TaxID=4460 RepID=A0A843XJ19_COLES|nr:hypothetical protein [Colocasia esculenta]
MRVQSLLRPTRVCLLRRPTVVETTLEPSSGKSYRSSFRYTLGPWLSSWWLPSEEEAPHSKPLRPASPSSHCLALCGPEPPKEARRGTIVRPDYGGYCCVTAPTLMRHGGLNLGRGVRSVCVTSRVVVMTCRTEFPTVVSFRTVASLLGVGGGAIVIVPIASSGIPLQLYFTLNDKAPRRRRQTRELMKQQIESDMPAPGQVQEDESAEESVAHPQGAAAVAAGKQQQQWYQPPPQQYADWFPMAE